MLPPSATPGTAILRENRRRDGLGTDEFDLTRCTHKRLHPSKSHVPGTRFLPRSARASTAMKLALTRRRLEVGLFRRPMTISDFFSPHTHKVLALPSFASTVHPSATCGRSDSVPKRLALPQNWRNPARGLFITGTRAQKQPRGHVNIVFPYTRTHG